MSRRTIYSVHDLDLEATLRELRVLEKIENKEIKCSICDQTITMENIGMLKVGEGSVEVCCQKIECFRDFTRR
jgi:Ni,Fe-hydrogenase maturation factor